MYMTNVFDMTSEQFRAWVVGGCIAIFVVFAVFNVFDGSVSLEFGK